MNFFFYFSFTIGLVASSCRKLTAGPEMRTANYPNFFKDAFQWIASRVQVPMSPLTSYPSTYCPHCIYLLNLFLFLSGRVKPVIIELLFLLFSSASFYGVSSPVSVPDASLYSTFTTYG